MWLTWYNTFLTTKIEKTLFGDIKLDLTTEKHNFENVNNSSSFKFEQLCEAKFHLTRRDQNKKQHWQQEKYTSDRTSNDNKNTIP